MPLRHLVVVVPGVGGSILQTPLGAARWDEHRRRFVAAATRPGRLALAEFPDLVPVDVLPTVTVAGPFVVPGYDRLVRGIINRFGPVRVDTARAGKPPDLSADVVLFPYDFRLSIAKAADRLGADIAARLEPVHPSARERRVLIVGHSMGGLVARHYAGPGGGARYCRALITVGTPHRGAPRALDVLANGLRVGGKRLNRLSEVLREWPSVYELLPRYPMIAQVGEADRSRQADNVDPLYPHQWDAQPDFARRAKEAFSVHQDIEAAWNDLAGIPERPAVTAILTRGHATLQQAVITAAGISVSKRPASWLPNPGWHGDGTVPAISAIPLELDDDVNARRPATERHVPLAAAATVVDMLAEYEGESLAAVRGDAPERPWLGLDLDEAALAGQQVPVGVMLHGEQAEELTQVHVRYRSMSSAAVPGPYTPWQEAERGSEGNSWHADLEPSTAGAYQVQVTAAGVPGVDRVTTEDTLSVVAVDAAGQEDA